MQISLYNANEKLYNANKKLYNTNENNTLQMKNYIILMKIIQYKWEII